MLLPGVLTFEGTPHALRTIGTIPAAYLFAGMGMYLTCRWFAKFFDKTRGGRIRAIVFLGLFLASVAIFSYYQYFILWASQPEVLQSFSRPFP
jgi:hypothetical protein